MGYFLPFYPTNDRKIKISKKWKKSLEISSFYTCVPKIMITRCTVPEIWCAKDRRTDRRMEKVTYRHSSLRLFIPPFQIISPFFDSPPVKKSLNLPFSILFFQTLNVVMLIASAKSRSARGASHKSAVMVSSLTISHMCLPYLPTGKVSSCVPGFTEVESCCYSKKWAWTLTKKINCV